MPRKGWRDKQTPEKLAEIAQQQRDYRNTPEGLKVQKIGSWKKQKMICDDWDAMYEKYTSCEMCECCGSQWKNSRDKHLDHCHKSGKVRNILCRRCNQLRGHIEKDYQIVLKLMGM